jgi:preprotein translocase subunit SecA
LRIYGLELPIQDWVKEEGIAEQEIRERLTAAVEKRMAEKEERSGSEVMRFAEKSILLQLLDQQWKDHLLNLDHLRQGIWLRAHGQRDPLNEYKREAFEMFEAMLTRVRESVTVVLAHIEVRLGPPPEEQAPPPPPPPQPRIRESRPNAALALAGAADAFAPLPAREDWGKVPRNAPCPCGSGKKYKYCHGRV